MTVHPKIQPAPEQERESMLADALHALLCHVDSTTCTHENTHRGGIQWTICAECGQQWADDMGGFMPYLDPEPVAIARATLAAIAQQPCASVAVVLDDYDQWYFGMEPRKSTLPKENDTGDFDGSEWRLT